MTLNLYTDTLISRKENGIFLVTLVYSRTTMLKPFTNMEDEYDISSISRHSRKRSYVWLGSR